MIRVTFFGPDDSSLFFALALDETLVRSICEFSKAHIYKTGFEPRLWNGRFQHYIQFLFEQESGVSNWIHVFVHNAGRWQDKFVWISFHFCSLGILFDVIRCGEIQLQYRKHVAEVGFFKFLQTESTIRSVVRQTAIATYFPADLRAFYVLTTGDSLRRRVVTL